MSKIDLTVEDDEDAIEQAKAVLSGLEVEGATKVHLIIEEADKEVPEVDLTDEELRELMVERGILPKVLVSEEVEAEEVTEEVTPEVDSGN